MDVVKIFDGAFHWPKALSFRPDHYKEFVEVYEKRKLDLFIPELKSGHKMNLKMTCLETDWSAKDYKYHYDSKNDSIPEILKSIISPFFAVNFPYHAKSWDTCIINEYDEKCALGLHVDNSESQEALDIGHPVVSVSIGLSAIFKLGGFTRNSECKEIILNDGDIFIFGGPSRLRYHGISKILPDSNCKLQKRINFTFRKI